MTHKLIPWHKRTMCIFCALCRCCRCSYKWANVNFGRMRACAFICSRIFICWFLERTLSLFLCEMTSLNHTEWIPLRFLSSWMIPIYSFHIDKFGSANAAHSTVYWVLIHFFSSSLALYPCRPSHSNRYSFTSYSLYSVVLSRTSHLISFSISLSLP